MFFTFISFFLQPNKKVEVPLFKYTNKNGHIIYVQPMQHIASEDFYRSVNEHIVDFKTEHPNGLVLLEGLHGHSKDKPECLDELKKCFGLNVNKFNLQEIYHTIATKLDWTSQNIHNYLKGFNVTTEGNNPDSSFIRADVTYRELTKELRMLNLKTKGNILTDIFTFISDENKSISPIQKRFLKAVLKTNFKKALRNDQVKLFSKLTDEETTKILDALLFYRNEKLFKTIEQYSEPLFITYGLAHLHITKDGKHSIHSYLTSLGYEQNVESISTFA